MHKLLHVCWEYPIEGWVKINCDGSVTHDLKAACGGLIHGAIGDFLGGFAANLGTCPATISELGGSLRRSCFGLEQRLPSSGA